MIKADPDSIMMVEPSAKISKEPLIDELTRKMTASWRKRKESGISYRGFHVCQCGVFSDNKDHFVDGEKLTNSLCIHYLAFHRDDIPPEELEKVRLLKDGEAEPTEEELCIPNKKFVRPEVFR